MQDIRIKYIYIKNFKKIDEFELSISDKSLYLIKGPNGSGKSSIFEAIYTCLYGSKPGTTDLEVVKKGEDSATIHLNLEVNGELYILERVLGKKSSFVITKDNTVLSDKLSTSKSLIENLIPKFIFELSTMSISSKNEIKSLIKRVMYSMIDLDTVFDKLKSEIDNINEKKRQILMQRSNLEGNI